ncbi:hypothetical protein S7335_5317 [Synechococcus sp. PCC 7335]|nr:hypothetical protein S7335_5317 [Synechococcus sp. PCC 7335]
MLIPVRYGSQQFAKDRLLPHGHCFTHQSLLIALGDLSALC